MIVPKKIRSIPWPEPWEGEIERQNFHVTVAQPVADGHRLLVVTVTRNRTHRLAPYPVEAVGDDFRLICDKRPGAIDVAYITERGKGTARKTLAEAISGWHTSPTYAYPEISEEDEAALCRWLGVEKLKKQDGAYNHAMGQLDTWTEDAIKQATDRERAARGEFMDEDVDLCPEEMPEGLIDYIHRVVLPEDDVLVYKKGNVRGTCYLCGEKVTAAKGQRFIQHGVATCPNCGQKVRTVLDGGACWASENLENVATIQLGTDGATLFIRQWRIQRPDDPAELWTNTVGCMREVARYAARGKFAAKWQKEAKETCYMRVYRYDLRAWVRVKDPANVYDGGYYFYTPENWADIVATTSLKYIDLAGYENRDRKAQGYGQNPIRFILDWARYPAVELLWKAGYTSLVAAKVVGALTKETRNTIRWSKTSIQEAIGIPLRILREEKPQAWDIDKVAKVGKMWRLVIDGVIQEWEIPELKTVQAEIRDIMPALRRSTVHKVVKYINGQVEKAKADHAKKKAEEKAKGRTYYQGAINVGQTYRDYLEDCEKLRLNLNDKQVLFPANLGAAHARTIAAIKHESDKTKETAYQAAVAKLEDLAWEKDGLLIRPAATARELIKEGKALHHCVGGYADRVARGETAIFLVRRVEEPDKPFFTLELRNKDIVQCRTDHNRGYETDAQVHGFVQEWLEVAVKRTKKRKTTKARKAA